VDKLDVLKKVKIGDKIMATVYKGDITLHDVMVMPPGKQDKQKSKQRGWAVPRVAHRPSFLLPRATGAMKMQLKSRAPGWSI